MLFIKINHFIKFNAQKVKNMENMLGECKSLQFINLLNFNTKKYK